jgi:hypothetical protein
MSAMVSAALSAAVAFHRAIRRVTISCQYFHFVVGQHGTDVDRHVSSNVVTMSGHSGQ